MSTQNIAATEYRNLPLSILTESKTNPRRIFDDAALKELADSIRSQGVLSPLLVRPLNERSFEIVAGARRYRAAQMAELETVPVRIVNLTDLLFLVERIAPMLDERRLEVVARNRGIKKAKDTDSIPKLLSAYIHKADEGELGRLLMEMVILHSARTQPDGGKVLKEAAEHYKVDTDAIALKVKQEFTAKEKARIANKSNPKLPAKVAKKSTAA